MAAKGGGAWKVAYADFVTAMMAFFLVMWICNQDQKIRKAVSDYFGDPLAVNQGTSKSPYRTGALFEGLQTGSIPEAESVAMGHGRGSYSAPGDSGRVTKLVSEWLYADNQAYQYWHKEGQRELELAQSRRKGDPKSPSAFETATRNLALRLKSKLTGDLPPGTKGVYQDLLQDAFAGVNWDEIAEDLLSR
jgi:flagellar motor protein MotB